MIQNFHAIWRDLLEPADVAALDPGVPDVLLHRPDVAVVGGGILGVTIGAACAEAGLGEVVVLERGRLGAEASGGAIGLLVPAAHSGTDPEWFSQLASKSLEEWRRLDADGGVGLVDVDWLGLEPHPPGYQPPPSAEILGPDAVAELVPGLRSEVSAVRVPGQGRVNPLQALARLAARQHGVATGVTVEDAVQRGGRIVELVTTAGSMTPGAVIFATGVPPQLPGLPLEVPFHRVKGHVVATAPAAVQLPGPVEPIGTPLPHGRILVGGTLDVDDRSPDVNRELAASMPDWLAAFLPSASGIDITHAWCCFRPAHADHLPVLDQLPGLDNAWLTSGHYRTGILMAPISARLLSQWVQDGRPPKDVAPLSLSRLAQNR